MTKDADKLAKLKALARDRAATAGERRAARRAIKKVERRVLLAEATTSNGGWDDPANAAYYRMLRLEQAEIDKMIVRFARKMMKQSKPDHPRSRRVGHWTRGYQALGYGYLIDDLDRHFFK